MTRNELIAAAIRFLGVYILVQTLIGLPNSLAFFVTYTVGFVRVLFNFGLEGAWNFFNLNALASFVSFMLSLILGWYLMVGGKWFYNKAARDAA